MHRSPSLAFVVGAAYRAALIVVSLSMDVGLQANVGLGCLRLGAGCEQDGDWFQSRPAGKTYGIRRLADCKTPGYRGQARFVDK